MGELLASDPVLSQIFPVLCFFLQGNQVVNLYTLCFKESQYNYTDTISNIECNERDMTYIAIVATN